MCRSTVLQINIRGYYDNDGSLLPMLRTKLSNTRGGSSGDQLLGELVAIISHRGDETGPGHWVTYTKVDDSNVFYLNDDSYRVIQSLGHPFASTEVNETCDALLLSIYIKRCACPFITTLSKDLGQCKA